MVLVLNPRTMKYHHNSWHKWKVLNIVLVQNLQQQQKVWLIYFRKNQHGNMYVGIQIADNNLSNETTDHRLETDWPSMLMAAEGDKIASGKQYMANPSFFLSKMPLIDNVVLVSHFYVCYYHLCYIGNILQQKPYKTSQRSK